MELVVQLKESDHGCIEDSGNFSSEAATLKDVADPVVYKLVRVDFDGRLVPATDDEVVEVENLLELEKNEIVYMSDAVETERQDLDKDDSKTSQCKGSPKSKNRGNEDNVDPALEDSLHALELNSRLVDKSGLLEGLIKSELGDPKPNFSLLKGEINLDKLTTQELQETFRATFGRVTSVKDKIWLKRRIAMGLTNSCDVSMLSFIFNNGKHSKKMVDYSNTMICEDPIAGEVCSAGDDLSTNSGSHPNDCVALKRSLADSACINDDILGNRAGKRFRKPTKRYIEQLSDNNPSGKSISPSKCSDQENSCRGSAIIKPSWSINTGAFVTRRDSIGGSGVQVPYVSRIRRCRPRQSIMTLSKFDSSDLAVTLENVESSDAPNKSQCNASSKAKLEGIRSVSFGDPISTEDLAEERSMSSMSDSSQNQKVKGVDSGGHASKDEGSTNFEDNIPTVPTTKGGMRRKHHRAWTLTEIVKLVDGVSRFGPGRWSEIKRLSFSSHSYRTAVDLKDKWRNLVKASSLPSGNGINPRMKTPFVVPAPILVKVRELAEMSSQAPQILKVSRDNGGQV